MPNAPSFQDANQRLRILLESSTPLLVIETVEEERALNLIRVVASDLRLPVFEWSISDGLVSDTATSATDSGIQRARSSAEMERKLAIVNASLAESNLPGLNLITGRQQFEKDNAPPPIYNTKDPAQMLGHLASLTIQAIFVLKDLHRHLDSPEVVRLLREVTQKFAAGGRTMILTSPAIIIPAELQNEVEYLFLPLPDQARLKEIVTQQFKRLSEKRKLQNKLDSVGLESVAANLGGLTEVEAGRACAEAIVTRYGLCAETITDVLESKREILRRSQMLDFKDAAEDLSQIGGLENLKKWLSKRRGTFTDAARAAGLEPPKGVILLGVQGCGKSICARAIAGEWKLPLVKFDASAIFDKYIGETEKRIKKLFQVAERLAPCVLWIDELEKVFAGSGADSASSDAGTSARVLGAFLSWMQDRTSPVFVAATCNNVSALPPELIRKGRFDELFFVDLPSTTERNAIFKIQLSKRKYDPAKFNLDALVRASQGFSGAEIDAALQSAMYASFADKEPVSTESLLAGSRETVPMSVTRAEDIRRLREWAKERAVPASLPDGTAAKV